MATKERDVAGAVATQLFPYSVSRAFPVPWADQISQITAAAQAKSFDAAKMEEMWDAKKSHLTVTRLSALSVVKGYIQADPEDNL